MIHGETEHRSDETVSGVTSRTDETTSRSTKRSDTVTERNDETTSRSDGTKWRNDESNYETTSRTFCPQSDFIGTVNSYNVVALTCSDLLLNSFNYHEDNV